MDAREDIPAGILALEQRWITSTNTNTPSHLKCHRPDAEPLRQEGRHKDRHTQARRGFCLICHIGLARVDRLSRGSDGGKRERCCYSLEADAKGNENVRGSSEEQTTAAIRPSARRKAFTSWTLWQKGEMNATPQANERSMHGKRVKLVVRKRRKGRCTSATSKNAANAFPKDRCRQHVEEGIGDIQRQAHAVEAGLPVWYISNLFDRSRLSLSGVY